MFGDLNVMLSATPNQYLDEVGNTWKKGYKYTQVNIGVDRHNVVMRIARFAVGLFLAGISLGYLLNFKCVESLLKRQYKLVLEDQKLRRVVVGFLFVEDNQVEDNQFDSTRLPEAAIKRLRQKGEFVETVFIGIKTDGTSADRLSQIQAVTTAAQESNLLFKDVSFSKGWYNVDDHCGGYKEVLEMENAQNKKVYLLTDIEDMNNFVKKPYSENFRGTEDQKKLGGCKVFESRYANIHMVCTTKDGVDPKFIPWEFKRGQSEVEVDVRTNEQLDRRNDIENRALRLDRSHVIKITADRLIARAS